MLKISQPSRSVVSKSRLVATLMDSGVEFVAVDNPHANKLTTHILAAVAEHEREAISERVLCLAFRMFVASITTELKFPAPVCDNCQLPMLTITEQQEGNGRPVNAVSYRCQKCGYRFGGQWRRPGCESVVLSFPNPATSI
jgi:Resolvase, N terminal domain